MTPQVTTAALRAALMVAVLLCGFIASGLLLTAISFGIERGDLAGNPHVLVQGQLRMSRAGDLAVVGFLVFEIAATWALMKVLGRRTISRVRAGVQAVLAFVGLSALSYAIVLADLMGLSSDPMYFAREVFTDWILKVVG